MHEHSALQCTCHTTCTTLKSHADFCSCQHCILQQTLQRQAAFLQHHQALDSAHAVPANITLAHDCSAAHVLAPASNHSCVTISGQGVLPGWQGLEPLHVGSNSSELAGVQLVALEVAQGHHGVVQLGGGGSIGLVEGVAAKQGAILCQVVVDLGQLRQERLLLLSLLLRLRQGRRTRQGSTAATAVSIGHDKQLLTSCQCNSKGELCVCSALHEVADSCTEIVHAAHSSLVPTALTGRPAESHATHSSEESAIELQLAVRLQSRV